MTTEVGAQLPTLVREITQAKIDRYSLASGDHNPLHTDRDFAAKTQFGGTVAHGMLLLAYLSEVLTAAFGRRWLEGGRLKVRFRAPARPGDTVTAMGSVTRVSEGRALCQVEVRSQREEVLISGEAEVSVPDG
ncbi:MAG: MaoC family dehydratase [Dehalococcoidia bacterium]